MKFIQSEKVFQNHFETMFKFHSTLNALIFEILSLMIIINFHNTFKIFLCVSKPKK
jgi:hypothetical protein